MCLHLNTELIEDEEIEAVQAIRTIEVEDQRGKHRGRCETLASEQAPSRSGAGSRGLDAGLSYTAKDHAAAM